jgi:hypothetical protein
LGLAVVVFGCLAFVCTGCLLGIFFQYLPSLDLTATAQVGQPPAAGDSASGDSVVSTAGTATPAGDTATATTEAPPTEAPPTETAVPTDTPPPTEAPPSTTMFFCGYDRCRDSETYGELTFPEGIPVWTNPDPDRGELVREARHSEIAQVIQERRVSEGPGGLWLELATGGWVSEIWLTDTFCSPDNLEGYSFTDCAGGIY